ncbi:uncharacterized protein LOC144110709 [Amblyomma americanum]
MAAHDPQRGRQRRSVCFDDGKRRIITTDLDPDLDPRNLKSVVGRPPTPQPWLSDCATSSSPNGQHGELAEASSPPPSAVSEWGVSAAAAATQQPGLSVVMHEPYPGRQWRSASFNDCKRRVIANKLDFEVDAFKLKPIVARPPTTRPSRTDCITSSWPDGLYEEMAKGSSRPHSAASERGVSAAAATQEPDESLDPELLMEGLTFECDGLADKDRAEAEPAL